MSKKKTSAKAKADGALKEKIANLIKICGSMYPKERDEALDLLDKL